MVSGFLYIFVIVCGLCVGSFLNVIIYRLSRPDFSFWKDVGGKNRSYCPHCSHQLAWYDLVPVASFFMLLGRCRYCQERISLRYPLVEGATTFLFLAIFYQVSQGVYPAINFLFLTYLISSLIVIFAYDLEHFIIPDNILLPAILVALLYQGILHPNYAILSYLLAGALSSSFFLLIFLMSRGQWIGFGDVKLAILMGLILGFPNILVALFLAFMFGAIIGLTLMVFLGKGLKSEVPFAPFLITGTLLSLFFGKSLVSWYVSLFIS